MPNIGESHPRQVSVLQMGGGRGEEGTNHGSPLGFSVAGVAAVLLLSTAVHQRKAGILGFDQERGQGSAQVHTDAITEDLTSLLDVREVGHGSAGL